MKKLTILPYEEWHSPVLGHESPCARPGITGFYEGRPIFSCGILMEDVGTGVMWVQLGPEKHNFLSIWSEVRRWVSFAVKAYKLDCLLAWVDVTDKPSLRFASKKRIFEPMCLVPKYRYGHDHILFRYKGE